jgi:hypothetical protein
VFFANCVDLISSNLGGIIWLYFDSLLTMSVSGIGPLWTVLNYGYLCDRSLLKVHSIDSLAVFSLPVVILRIAPSMVPAVSAMK